MITSNEIEFEIVKAELKDAIEISALVNSVYRGENSKKGWTTEADLLGGQRTDVEEILNLIQTEVILCLRSTSNSTNGKILASVLLEKKDNYAYLGMLSVDAESQSQQLGRKLIFAAEAWVLSKWNLNLIKITVIAQRPELIQWYERRGFIKTGELENFPMNNPRFGIPRRDDLFFVVLQKRF